jgi:hypothetical protein
MVRQISHVTNGPKRGDSKIGCREEDFFYFIFKNVFADSLGLELRLSKKTKNKWVTYNVFGGVGFVGDVIRDENVRFVFFEKVGA